MILFKEGHSDQDTRVIESIASESFYNQRFLTIRLSNENRGQEITGIVKSIDQDQHKINFSHDRGIEWISVDNILSVEINVD